MIPYVWKIFELTRIDVTMKDVFLSLSGGGPPLTVVAIFPFIQISQEDSVQEVFNFEYVSIDRCTIYFFPVYE